MPADDVIESFLKLSMRVTRDPKVKKVSQRLEYIVEGEVKGFKRAQEALRQMRDEDETREAA